MVFNGSCYIEIIGKTRYSPTIHAKVLSKGIVKLELQSSFNRGPSPFVHFKLDSHCFQHPVNLVHYRIIAWWGHLEFMFGYLILQHFFIAFSTGVPIGNSHWFSVSQLCLHLQFQPCLSIFLKGCGSSQVLQHMWFWHL